MARPKTHGAPISFRLPIDYDNRLAERAADKGESPAEYVRRNIIQALDGRRNGAKSKSLAREKVTPIPKAAPAKATTRKRAVGR